jgi:thiol-disulfide isomerase/thioredoxin
MTLDEAKKILEKEGFVPERFLGVLVEDVKAASWEKIEVSEAMKVVAENGYFPFMEKSKYEERKERLKKEYEKNTKAPGSAENRIKEDSGVNPALAESASQFNDALLDEQAKKIAELTKDKELMKKATLSQLDDFIEIYNLLTKESQKTERLGKEIAKLNGIIHDKNAVLADVAEELRLSKIREKNLTGVSQKYMKENEELRKELADKVIDKIDTQALKSAESALAWKEKVIAEKDMALAYNEKEIADLQEKLAATKKELEGANNLVEIVRKGSKEYCEYCIAAEKMIQKMAKEFVNDKPVSSKDYEQYRLLAKGYRFNPQLPDFSEEEEKSAESVIAYKDEVIETLDKELAEAKHELSSLKRPFRPESTEAVVLFANAYAKAVKKRLRCAEWRNDGKEVSITYILKNGKKSKITLDFTGDEIIFSRTDPDKKPRIPAPEEPKHDNIFEDFINKTIDNYNRRAANLGCVGSKDGNGIFDQMVEVDNAEKGGDNSGVIVLCGKDFIDAIKKMK